MTFYERRREWERREVQKALKRSRGRVHKAAELLGINRTYFYNLCMKLGMRIERKEGNWAMHGL